MLLRRCYSVILAFMLLSSTLAAEEPLIAHWKFDEGEGDVLHDSIGGQNGTLYGPQWVNLGKRFALRFDGVDDYVDCGTNLKLDAPVTLTVWVRPDAIPISEPGLLGNHVDSLALTYYKTGSAFFYIASGGNHTSAPLRTGLWSHLAAVFDGSSLTLYVNGQPGSTTPSKLNKIPPVGHFFLGLLPGNLLPRDPMLAQLPCYKGLMDDVRIYSTSLSQREIASLYNQLAPLKRMPPVDLSLLDRLRIELFPYPERNQLVVSTDCRGLQPSAGESTLRVELHELDGSVPPVIQTIPANDRNNIPEVSFTLDSNSRMLLVKSVLLSIDGIELKRTEDRLDWPPVSPALPLPAERIVGATPAPYTPSPFQYSITSHGGILVSVGGQNFPIESRFSFPHGGENHFSCKSAPEDEESVWTPVVEQRPDGQWFVHATGQHYSLQRSIRATSSRIEIDDTFTNRSDKLLGIIFDHRIDTSAFPDPSLQPLPNPTVFASAGGVGLGLLALDDVFQMQLRTLIDGNVLALRDDHFGLDVGQSYTVSWAIYPTGSEDYFDFISQVRRDEGLHGRVEGCVELTSRWGPPPPDLVANKRLKYVSACYLTNSLRNPLRSLEGWEFVEYPELRQRIAQAISETKSADPSLRPMFHVAHSLYLTGKSDLFADSQVRDELGNRDHYGPNDISYYGNYLEKSLFEEGWRWWLFYPTKTNAFGQLMSRASDQMLDELGAEAIWADGYISQYVKGEYTYDTWDGHSVTIDPQTKLAIRKKAHAALVSLSYLVEIVEKFAARNKTFITNDRWPPRSMWKLPMITSNETGGGDQQAVAGLHVSPTVTPLGYLEPKATSRDLHRDILRKLRAGALYFPYGDRDLITEPSIISHYYPITFGSIHAGCVRGSDRIITMNSGIYSFSGNRRLHSVHLADARGILRPNASLSTFDSNGVRTSLHLAPEQIAVIAQIPIVPTDSTPFNFRILQYDESKIEIVLAGNLRSLLIDSGTFPIRPLDSFHVRINQSEFRETAREKRLEIPFPTTSHLHLEITPEGR